MASECSQATLLADRCHEYRQAEIDKQRAAARQDWRRQREERLGRLVNQMDRSPATAVAGLGKFGFGVHWLAESFEGLILEIRTQGYLSEDSAQWAVRCYGVTSAPEQIRGNPVAYIVFVNNLACTPGLAPEVLDAWLEPARRPDVYRDGPRSKLICKHVNQSQAWVILELEAERDRLRSEAERFEREIDGPSLEAALRSASILTEDAARRVARSHGEARAAFHRALPQFYRTLDRDAEEGPLEEASDDDTTPAAEPAEQAGD